MLVQGPTIWPIVFSAVIGRFLTSIATWRLERGVDVASVEYLLGSRTVFGVISTLLRLRFLHYALPFLLSLWVLSPLGGQTSLRVVAPNFVYSNQTTTVAYLESLSPYWLGRGFYETFEWSVSASTTDAVFVGALIGPRTTKDAYQDIYGNLKIPLLESVKTKSSPADADGWYTTKTNASLIYSSLIGLPTVGISEEGKTYLAIESSYLYSTCTLSGANDDEAWIKFKEENCHNDGGYLAIDLNADDESRDGWDPSLNPETIRTPRTIVFSSPGMKVNCVTTTTYVETRFACDGRRCEPTAIRESRLKHNPSAATTTFLDGVDADSGRSDNAAESFCSYFIESTGVQSGTFSALERYFTNPDTPLVDPGLMSFIDGIDDTVFSQRFAQLLNSYWLALVAPYPITGNFSAQYDASLPDQGGKGTARNTTAQLETVESVLVCHTVWLVLLILGSLVMIAAGMATTVINLFRKAPEVLDSFAGMLRDSPHVHAETGPSIEDAFDKARRLQKMRVILGDVRPTEAVGYVAFATCEGKDDGDGVQRLRAGRTYW